MQSERQSATSRPRRAARAGEELAARQSGRREPGRLSRRPGNAGSSRRPSPDAEACAARPGLAYPRSRALGTTTRTPGGAYCQSWSLLGLSRLGESAWAFLGPGRGGGVLTNTDPSGLRPSPSPRQRSGLVRGVRPFLRALGGPVSPPGGPRATVYLTWRPLQGRRPPPK